MDARRQSIEDTAADWVGRNDGGLTPAEEKEFATWLNSDPQHRAAHARLAAGSMALDRLRELRPAGTSAVDPDLSLTRRSRKVAWLPVILAAAAAVAIGIVVLNRNTPRSFSDSTSTTAGIVRKMNLPDGSVVDLNGETTVEVNFAPTERRVHLRRGEAHFAVAKDSARPFFVEAAGVTVRAVGTAFNVRLGSDTVDVLVTEGRVRVDDAKGASLLSPKPGTEAPVLAAGERLVLQATSTNQAPVAVEQIEPAEVSRLLAWQQRKLDFKPTPLAQIVAEFNRSNQHQLVIGDASIAKLRVGGSLRADDPEAFVRLLEAHFGVVADRENDRTVLRARK